MTARVLVVDDILANVRLLEAKLSAEYFDVVTAMNGGDALEAVQRNKPDIVLLDVMMPGIDGIEVCRRIKSNPQTQHIPVIMVTALDQPEDRVRGLEAGADDFLTKPVNDLSLFCRVKSLVRLKMLTDELRARADTNEQLTLGSRGSLLPIDTAPGWVMVVDNRTTVSKRVQQALAGRHEFEIFTDAPEALAAAGEAQKPFELIVINLGMENVDGLRLCSQLRSLERTRQTPILIIVDPDDHQRLLRALDMGVNDYLIRPIDKQELLARVNTQVRRWRYTEQLRKTVQESIELAVTDSLTGLYNRRYMETHMVHLLDNAANRGKSLSVAIFDVDHFKMINDTYGHDTGDRVLQELANRLRQNIRNIDIACRIGGEEFILVLPSANIGISQKISERIRLAISGRKFDVGGDVKELDVTVSAGVAQFGASNETMEGLLKRADNALYQAKKEGRNRVILAA